MSRQTELAQIHIAKKQLDMDEDTYRMMLNNITGHNSTRDMDLQDRYRVLAHLKKIGFKSKRGKKRLSPKSKGTQLDVIRAIWIEMAKDGYIKDGSETALDHWVARMTARYNKGKGIDSVAWLDEFTAQRVLEALKKWQRRLEVERINDYLDKIKHLLGSDKSVNVPFFDWLDEYLDKWNPSMGVDMIAAVHSAEDVSQVLRTLKILQDSTGDP